MCKHILYDDICACSELRDRCFKKAEQARDSHFSAFIHSVRDFLYEIWSLTIADSMVATSIV